MLSYLNTALLYTILYFLFNANYQMLQCLTKMVIIIPSLKSACEQLSMFKAQLPSLTELLA